MPGLIMKYFVLKPAGSDHYALSSRLAMRAYAQSIEVVNPQLAADLEAWADNEMFDAEAGDGEA